MTYIIRCGNNKGTTDRKEVDGYTHALQVARLMAYDNQHCAIIYTYSADGLKVKNTIAPDGRMIKNGAKK